MSNSRKEMLKMLADKEGHLERLKRIRDKKAKRVEEDKARRYKKPERKDSTVVRKGKEIIEELVSGVSHYGDDKKKAKREALRRLAGKKE